MPFGLIPVNFAEKHKKSPKPEPVVETAPQPPTPDPAPAAYPPGTGVLHLAVIAPTAVEASDFVCGAYFNMVRMAGGSDISVYTKDFATIRQLTGRKHSLENVALSSDTPSPRTLEGEDGLADCVVTVSPAGNQSLSLDLHFHCAALGAAPEAADAVFFLLRSGDQVPPPVSGVPTFYLAAGQEKRSLFFEEHPSPVIRTRFRDDLIAELGLSRGSGVFFGLVQVYGGLLLTGREGGAPILQTNSNCRDYLPVGCHFPIFTAIGEIARRRVNELSGQPVYQLYSMIGTCFHNREPARSSWCGAYEEVR